MQTCHLEIGSFAYTARDVVYKWQDQPFEIDPSVCVKELFCWKGPKNYDLNVCNKFAFRCNWPSSAWRSPTLRPSWEFPQGGKTQLSSKSEERANNLLVTNAKNLIRRDRGGFRNDSSVQLNFVFKRQTGFFLLQVLKYHKNASCSDWFHWYYGVDNWNWYRKSTPKSL